VLKLTSKSCLVY